MNRLEELFKEIIDIREELAIVELRELAIYDGVPEVKTIQEKTNTLLNIKILQSSYISFN